MLLILFLLALSIACLWYFTAQSFTIRLHEDPETEARRLAETAREAERLNPLDPRD